MKKLMFASFACAALFFASCSGSSNSNTEATTEATTDTPAEEAPAAAPEESTTATIPGLDTMKANNTINITGNDQMKFDKTLFKVKAGQAVTLTLKNVGKLPATAMSHDVVVVKVGTDVTTFGNAVAQAKDHDTKNLTPDQQSQIIAQTKMLGPGESAKITFTLPAAGVYPFMCTFPGHFMTMQGKIVAE